MNRRSVLALFGVTSLPFSGCLGGSGETNTATETPTPTSNGTETETPTSNETEILREDSVYVENFDDDPYRLRLKITKEGTEEVILNNKYELPAERGIEIPEVGHEQQTYSVKVVIEDGPRGTYEWTIDDCDFNNGEDTALGIQIKDGHVNFLTNDCDVVSVGYELTYSYHQRYIIEEETETATEQPAPSIRLQVFFKTDLKATLALERLTDNEIVFQETEEYVDGERINLTSEFEANTNYRFTITNTEDEIIWERGIYDYEGYVLEVRSKTEVEVVNHVEY